MRYRIWSSRGYLGSWLYKMEAMLAFGLFAEEGATDMVLVEDDGTEQRVILKHKLDENAHV